MSLITQYSRVSHHTITTSGLTGTTSFTVPSSEDFTDGSWTNFDLALSEIGVDEDRGRAFIRIGNEVKEFQFSATTDTYINSGNYSSNRGVLTLKNTTGGTINISGFYTGSTTPTLDQVLTAGNTAFTKDIILDTSRVIKTTNGGGQLNLDYFGANEVLLSTDNGNENESYLYLSPQYAQLAAANGSVQFDDTNNRLDINVANDSLINMRTGSSGFTIDGLYNNLQAIDTLKFIDNVSIPFTTADSVKPALAIGSRNSTINTAITNTVIIGGSGITATASNTAYVPDLVIQTGKAIKTNNGGGQIELDAGGTASNVLITTDNGAYGESYIIMDSSTIEVGASAGNDFMLFTNGQIALSTTGNFTVQPLGNIDASGTLGAFILPKLTAIQRNSLTATNGMLIYNITTNKFQGYENGSWVDLI